MNEKEYYLEMSQSLREFRVKNNIKAQDIAKSLGMSSSTYCFMEKGKRKLKIHELIILIREYNFPNPFNF